MDFFHPSLLSMEHEAHADPNNLLHHFRQQSVAMDLDSFRDGIEASSCPLKLARTHSFCTTRRQHQPELKTNLDSAMSYAAGPYLHLYKSSGLHLNDEEAAEDQPPWPFTFSQFRELQQQALIFKYMMHGLPVPPHLIISIRHSLLESLASLAGNVGWRNYHHLSFAGNCADPEPGRCRRTDGKKWRCAREVVPNQKYCERHMHRGRHRAKKAAPSFLSTITTSPSSITTTPTISLGALHTHHAEDTTSSSSLSFKSLNATLSQTNLHHFPFKSAAKDDEKDHDYLNGDMHLGSSQMLSSTKQSGYNGEAEAMRKVEPLQFFDDWPRSRDAATTKLSMKSSDFSLKLSMCNGSAEEDALAAHEVGNVGIGGSINEERQAKWIPIVWETSPLAEVLQSSSTLNLMTRGDSPKHSSTMANSSSRGFLKNAASANSLSESGSGSI